MFQLKSNPSDKEEKDATSQLAKSDELQRLVAQAQRSFSSKDYMTAAAQLDAIIEVRADAPTPVVTAAEFLYGSQQMFASVFSPAFGMWPRVRWEQSASFRWERWGRPSATSKLCPSWRMITPRLSTSSAPSTTTSETTRCHSSKEGLCECYSAKNTPLLKLNKWLQKS